MRKITVKDLSNGRNKADYGRSENNVCSHEGPEGTVEDHSVAVSATRSSFGHAIVDGLCRFISFCFDSDSLQSRLVQGVFYHRRFPRVKCHHLVKCCYINDEQRCWVSNLRDISEGGLKLWTPEPLQSTDIVRLVIYFARLDQQLTVVSKMVWTESASYDGQGYVAGFSFLNVEAARQDFLHQYIQAHLN